MPRRGGRSRHRAAASNQPVVSPSAMTGTGGPWCVWARLVFPVRVAAPAVAPAVAAVGAVLAAAVSVVAVVAALRARPVLRVVVLVAALTALAWRGCVVGKTSLSAARLGRRAVIGRPRGAGTRVASRRGFAPAVGELLRHGGAVKGRAVRRGRCPILGLVGIHRGCAVIVAAVAIRIGFAGRVGLGVGWGVAKRARPTAATMGTSAFVHLCGCAMWSCAVRATSTALAPQFRGRGSVTRVRRPASTNASPRQSWDATKIARLPQLRKVVPG